MSSSSPSDGDECGGYVTMCVFACVYIYVCACHCVYVQAGHYLNDIKSDRNGKPRYEVLEEGDLSESVSQLIAEVISFDSKIS